MLLIKNGNIIKNNKLEKYDILIEYDKISKIEKKKSPGKFVEHNKLPRVLVSWETVYLCILMDSLGWVFAKYATRSWVTR